MTGTQNSTAGSETLQWDLAGGAAPRTLPTGEASSIEAINANGSLLVSAADGPGLLRHGVLRTLAEPGGRRISPRGLSDADIVYGNLNGDQPGYADCVTQNRFTVR